MEKPVYVFLEIGKKRTFAGAVDWPGWIRAGRDEDGALQALLETGPRYAGVIQGAGLDLAVPATTSDFHVTERVAGNATTDFGAPDATLVSDSLPVSPNELARFQSLLRAYWAALDKAIEAAAGRELRKGPRGGGRELNQLIAHVVAADQAYLRRLAWKLPEAEKLGPDQGLGATRQAIRAALTAAVEGSLPEQGPRGGKIWPPREFVRRTAWHVLDHAWEIEDRLD